MTTTIQFTITEEHRKILTLLEKELTRRQIAVEMCMSKSSLNNAINDLFQAFNCCSCQGLVAKAIRNGVI